MNLKALLPLDSGKSDPLDKCSLRKEEEHDYRDRQYCCNSHHPTPLNAYRANEHLDAKRKRILAGIVEVNERPDKVVPASQELKKGHSCQGRL